MQSARRCYVRARRITPSWLVAAMKKNRRLVAIARRLQPSDGSMDIYRLEGPLEGHLMRIPAPHSYTMAWGEYEPVVTRAIEGTVKKGQTAVDLGAYVGYHTLLLARLTGEEGKVYAFEPVPGNRAFLLENLSLNDYAERVQVVPMAVAEETRLSRMDECGSSSQSSLEGCGTTTRTARNSFVVPACALDDYFSLLEWPRVDFIKMDIEGAESRAIAGMLEVLKRDHPVILLEAHGEQAREGLSALQGMGYMLERLGANRDAGEIGLPGTGLGHAHWLIRP